MMEEEEDNKLCVFHTKSHVLYDKTLPKVYGICCLCDDDNATHLAICNDDVEHCYCCKCWNFKEMCSSCDYLGCTICGTLIYDEEGHLNFDGSILRYCRPCFVPIFVYEYIEFISIYSKIVYNEFKDMKYPPKFIIKSLDFFISISKKKDKTLLYLEKCIKKGHIKKKEEGYEINVHNILSSRDTKNRCIECLTDMGDSNPRQMCGKTRCLAQN